MILAYTGTTLSFCLLSPLEIHWNRCFALMFPTSCLNDLYVNDTTQLQLPLWEEQVFNLVRKEMANLLVHFLSLHKILRCTGKRRISSRFIRNQGRVRQGENVNDERHGSEMENGASGFLLKFLWVDVVDRCIAIGKEGGLSLTRFRPSEAAFHMTGGYVIRF